MNKNINDILMLEEIKTLLNNGGASLKGGRPKNLKSGFMVSLCGFEICVKSTHYKRIIKAIKKQQQTIDNMKQAYNKNAYYVGLWVDNGICYIDISIRVSNKKQALIMGLLNNQLAIYSNKTNESIYL